MACEVEETLNRREEGEGSVGGWVMVMVMTVGNCTVDAGTLFEQQAGRANYREECVCVRVSVSSAGGPFDSELARAPASLNAQRGAVAIVAMQLAAR